MKFTTQYVRQPDLLRGLFTTRIYKYCDTDAEMTTFLPPPASFHFFKTYLTNSRYLQIEINLFDPMYNTVRRTFNNKRRKAVQIKLYKAMAVLMRTYRSQIWKITRKMKQKWKLYK